MLARVFTTCLLLCVALLVRPAELVAADWQAGVARANITPQESIWMSGYASRTHGADGKLTDLWAKAIVIADPAGNRIAAVTLDLVGLDRPTSLAIRDGMSEARHPRRILRCSVHTHTDLS
jgi:hypothetical protein